VPLPYRISFPAKELRVIRGERLYLRSIERDDLARCHDWMNDPDLRATLAQRFPMSLAKEADWVERATRGQDPSEMLFAICLMQGDRHIGNCGFEAIDRDNGTATFGIFIGEADCRGQGLGEEAVRTLCRFGFEELRLAKVRLDVYEGNPAIRTYERVGFRREGVLRQEIFRRGGRRDVIRMGLLVDELIPESRGGARARPRAAARAAPPRKGTRR
jgi:RimJ/RimL family protein N-acetyltransferase